MKIKSFTLSFLRWFFLSLLLFVGSIYMNAEDPSPVTPSGDGSVENPYQIGTLENLYWVAVETNGGNNFSGKYIIQTANINASATSGWFSFGSDAYYGWTPIGEYQGPGYYSFNGSYDGQGYEISSLYIDRYTHPQYNVGLFGYCANATIKNIGLVNASVKGYNSVGILVGVSETSTIQNCYSTGEVICSSNGGGLIGWDYFSSTSSCYSTASVTGTDGSLAGDFIDLGGFTGVNDGCTISNCYATGTVTGNTNTWIGGFAGESTDDGITENCYSTGLIVPNGSVHFGGFIGYVTSGTSNNCFWDTETSNQPASATGTGKTTAQMKEASTYTGWSNATWRLEDGNYPLLFAPGTFTGAVNNDWATAGNWPEGSVPTSSINVTVPSDKTVVIGATTSASCKNLTNSGSFTIESSSSGTGSLIISGTATGSVNCQRYMTNGKWHLISPTASGQTVADFLTANTNIPTSSTTRGMMDYNTLGNSWNSYYPTTGASGTMDAGKGYAARIATADGTITFAGTLTSGTKTVSLTTTGQGWNCVGNPYSSAINMNTTADASNNFITVNSSNLDPSYACVYVWDEDATYTGQSCYKVICNSGYSTSKTILAQNYVAPGQGFFVKANSSATNISFTSAMQSQQVSTAFKAPASNTSWPGITLIASGDNTSSTAVIAFNANMSKGLDPTYDAGLLRGTNGLSLYTRLLEDNGVDFAIQCLPEEYDHLVIPVGVDYNAGGEITFTAETTGLPKGCKLFLEDKTTKTFTSLLGGETYRVAISPATSGIGRFYVHTGTGVTTGTTDLALGTLKVYMDNGTIIISGEVNEQAIAALYDMQGQKLSIDRLKNGLINKISCPKSSGVYLLTIQQDGMTITRKVINK